MRISLRKNKWLIVSLLILLSILFGVALVLTYTLTKKFVDNEFEAGKVGVLEKSIASYNDFTQNGIAEVSYYQGFLDSASASKYAKNISNKFPFVERLVFFDIDISQHYKDKGFKFRDLFLSPRAIYQFGKEVPANSVLLYKAGLDSNYSLLLEDDFNKMAIKFASFIESADTMRSISNEEIFKNFYSIKPGKLSYMTLPRREEVIQFKNMMNGHGDANAVYHQDIITYFINPAALKIFNTQPELYEHVEIKPVFYESTDTEEHIKHTEIPLPAALSEYKIYFSSSSDFIQYEIIKRFLPMGFGILMIYIIFLVIAYLIYRNLKANLRMFKLQYDFVNNLSHEFKTPVSVIKIAGNNIINSKGLTEKEKNFYGKILDEEADKLNNLLNTLLSFTQIENNIIKPKLEEIDLKEFCESMVNSYRIKYPDFDINFKIENVRFFKTDLTMLTSVFQNLIDNAYRYSTENRKYMRIFIFKQNRQIFFKFEDRGIGIENSEKENVFKKFYRIQSEYNQQGSVGLGLAFCKEVVKLMNGDISVESKKDVGSIFTMILPYEFPN
jgi:two-component system phosphate regulon sensor histidine kinase PhoR